MPAASVPVRLPQKPLRSKRWLALADDARLVEHIRRGSEAAFEVAFERHGRGILGFCRHMLGSVEEAEDAVQHTFAAAFRDLTRDDARHINLKPWLYTIARNRCLSMLRARREQPMEPPELATSGLADAVQQRAELRELLADLRELPEDQRAALLLSELGDLSHVEVAGVLGCEVPKVKALVFRARSGLIARRDARATPCGEIREQLANLRGGSLRRRELRHHVAICPGCSEFRDQVKRQRQMLAVALPVAPALGLKKSVLAAVGIGGAAGGGAAGGGGAALGLGGLTGALGSLGSLGSATVAKVALVGALTAGGAVAGTVAVDEVRQGDGGGSRVLPASAAGERPASNSQADARAESEGGRGEQVSAERRVGARGEERSGARSRGQARAGAGTGAPTSEPGPERGLSKRALIEERAPANPAGGERLVAPPARSPAERRPSEPRLEPAPRVRKLAPLPAPTPLAPDVDPTSTTTESTPAPPAPDMRVAPEN